MREYVQRALQTHVALSCSGLRACGSGFTRFMAHCQEFVGSRLMPKALHLRSGLRDGGEEGDGGEEEDLISVHQQLAQIRQLAYHRLCARVVSCAPSAHNSPCTHPNGVCACIQFRIPCCRYRISRFGSGLKTRYGHTCLGNTDRNGHDEVVGQPQLLQRRQ